MTKSAIAKVIACGFIISGVFSMFGFAASCENISENVIRIHVLANSNSKEDQEIKLMVRDAVLEESKRWYGDADSLQQANINICTNLQTIERAGQKASDLYGSGQRVRARMTEMYFTTKNYENISMPAGKYRTLRITIGEGQGDNWWCVVYPALCVPSAQGEETITFSGSGKEIMENPQKYRLRFKFMEVYQNIVSFFDR